MKRAFSQAVIIETPFTETNIVMKFDLLTYLLTMKHLIWLNKLDCLMIAH